MGKGKNIRETIQDPARFRYEALIRRYRIAIAGTDVTMEGSVAYLLCLKTKVFRNGVAAALFLFASPSFGAACPEDVKICPDGNPVFRQGSNCTFPSCSNVTGGCTRDLKTCPDGSKLSRDPGNQCRFPACPTVIIDCQEDAKVCPDGTTLMRDPKNQCKFPACPGSSACQQDTKVCPDGTNLSRDPKNQCKFPACPPRRTATRTSTNTRTRTRTETVTATSTTTAVDIDTPSPDGTGQSVAFCNMAAVSALSSVLHLDSGARDQSLAAYQNAEEQVRRANGLNSNCPVPSSGASILDQDQVSPIAAKFEQTSGLPRGEIFAQVHDMATKAADGAPPSALDGLLGFIGKFPDESTQERLKKNLTGDSTAVAVEEKPKTDGESAISVGAGPKAPTAPAAADFPVSTAAATSEPTRPTKTLTKAEKELLEKKTRILEEIRDRELNELDSIIAKNEELPFDRNQAEVSVFQRVSRIYRKVGGGMSRPSITGLERKPKK